MLAIEQGIPHDNESLIDASRDKIFEEISYKKSIKKSIIQTKIPDRILNEDADSKRM